MGQFWHRIGERLLRIMKYAVLLVITTSVSNAVQTAFVEVTSSDAQEHVIHFRESLQGAVESLQITEIGLQYLIIWGPDPRIVGSATPKAYQNCLAHYNYKPRANSRKEIQPEPEQCGIFIHKGPITGWIREHLTDFMMNLGSVYGIMGFALTSIAAFVDLVWITFWQYGVVPRIVGLVELALGFSVAIWVSRWWTDADGKAKPADEGPMPLMRSGMFCVGVVLCACLVAAVTYGFGLLVAHALSYLPPSMKFLNEVKANGLSGGIIGITLFFILSFFMDEIEHVAKAAAVRGFEGILNFLGRLAKWLFSRRK
jgi:hypothetical protein